MLWYIVYDHKNAIALLFKMCSKWVEVEKETENRLYFNTKESFFI